MRLAQLNSELNIDDKAPIEAAIEDAQDVPSIHSGAASSIQRKRNGKKEQKSRKGGTIDGHDDSSNET